MSFGAYAVSRAGGSLAPAGGNESKMTGAGRGGKTVPLGYQEPISCDA